MWRNSFDKSYHSSHDHIRKEFNERKTITITNEKLIGYLNRGKERKGGEKENFPKI